MTRPLQILFPKDPLNHKRADPHFADEAKAALDLGIPVGLVDHGAIANGNHDEALHGVKPTANESLYRGWMIAPNRYREFEREAAKRGVRLRTTAEQYETAHHLPNWYEQLKGLSPESKWTDTPSLDAFEEILNQMDDCAAVIKDYSKSEKHYWAEAMFIPDVRDVGQAYEVVERFVELRGDFFDTGFVIRRFEQFEGTEARTWWVDGQCALVTAHPDSPGDQPTELEVPSDIADAIGQLGLPFISADLVVDVSGRLRVIEIGDGQVSDRPTTADPTGFIQALTSSP